MKLEIISSNDLNEFKIEIIREFDLLLESKLNRKSNEVILTKKEAANYLGCSQGAIDDRRKKKSLPSYKNGKLVVLKKSDLDKYLDRHKKLGI